MCCQKNCFSARLSCSCFFSCGAFARRISRLGLQVHWIVVRTHELFLSRPVLFFFFFVLPLANRGLLLSVFFIVFDSSLFSLWTFFLPHYSVKSHTLAFHIFPLSVVTRAWPPKSPSPTHYWPADFPGENETRKLSGICSTSICRSFLQTNVRATHTNTLPPLFYPRFEKCRCPCRWR